jgi:hypothetical protein
MVSPAVRLIRVETDMETLFFLGQIVSLVALVWGAVLCLTSKNDDEIETLYAKRMSVRRGPSHS